MTSAETGALGEQATADFLLHAGYKICARNWRHGHYELDIIARKGEIIHFVEVKTRRTGSLTPPEAAITRQKFRSLHRAASYYLASEGHGGEAQFDLAAVEVASDGSTKVEIVENAMEYNW